MKFTAERDALLTALTTAGRAVGRMSIGAPSIELKVTDGTLTAKGFDNDLVIAAATPVNGDDGVIRLPARLATDVVKAMDPGAVAVASTDDEATISAGRAEFTLRALAEVYESPTHDIKSDPVAIEAPSFAEGLRQVIPAALKDDSRAPQLTGVALFERDGGVRLVATDSYRLAIKDVAGLRTGGQGEGPTIIPARALAEVQRLLGEDRFTFERDELSARFIIGATTITTRLLRGPFPDYERLIPADYPSTFIADRAVFAEAIKRVRVMAATAKDVTPVRMTFAADGLTLVVRTAEQGSATERVEGQLDGAEGEVAFNGNYFADGLECATGDDVRVSFIDASKPGTISGEDGSFSYLIMPIRIT